MTTWIAGVDSVTKRFPPAVEDALASSVVGPAATAIVAGEIVTTTSLKAQGASGVSTQDATPFAVAAFAQVTKGSGVPAVSVAAPGGTYRLTNTVLWDRIAPTLAGAGSGNPGDHANPGKGTTFIWDGPAGVPMFRVRDCQNVVVKDILILGNDANPPSELFYFENDGSAGQVGTNQLITFERVTFGRYGYANTTYSGHSKTTRCVRFGGTNVNNDQAWFYDCQFGGASDALVAFDNSNTLWCNFINCYFDGRSMDDLVTPTAAGLRTSACVMLINPQFNRCNPDIDVQNGMANVYMWNSENSAMFARIGNSAGLLAHAGAMVAHSSTMGANMFDATALGTDGELSLTDIRFRTALGMWPKIKVRGSASALAGRVVVRDCGLPADCYDVQAHATGSGGVIVKIDDGDLVVRKHLLAGATLTPPPAAPLRVGGYLADGSALSDLLAQLAAAGLIQPAALHARATRTNQLVNPRFASSSSGWTKSANVTATTVGETVELAVDTAITAGNSIVYNTAAATAVAGDAWSAGATVKLAGGTTRQRVRLEVRSYPSNTIVGATTAEFVPGEEKRISVDGAVVATGDNQVRMVLSGIDYTLPVGVTVVMSRPVLEQAAVAGAPFSGASSVSGWTAAWTGAADNSTSTLTDATPAARPAPDTQVFTASGTWTKPAGAVTVQALTIAGGSGGGAGRRGAAGTVRCGGGGGGGGGITQRTIVASLCGATETVTVGAGGTGGAAITTDDTDGANGTAGGSSSFGSHAKSNAPGAGSGGTNAAGTAGSAGSALIFGGAGGAASATGGTGSVGAVVGGATGGGGGGGITSGNSPSAGGNGGTPGSTGRSGSAGAAVNASATSSADSPANSGEPGGGGGGGGASITGAAGAGANGALYGAGGGGGGASLNGNNSGKGGDGAAGIVIVTTYF